MLQKKKKSDAFTLVELLLGLAITVVLLVAVAAALNASAMNYKTNEDIYKAMNGARQAMTRMTSQLRDANAVDLNDLANQYQCSLFTAADENITYQFRSADNKLYLITNANGNEYVLCDNVTAATFKTQTDDGTKCKSVQISLTVTVGSISQSLSAASVIRRNLQ